MRANTIVEGEYGYTKYEGHPADYRAEPTDAEKAEARKADQIPGTVFMKQSGLSVDELNALVESHGFPRGVRKRVGGNFMFPKYDVVYSRLAIAAWQERSAYLARAINAKKF